MALLRNVPPPIGDAIALPKRKEYKGDARDPQEGRITRSWIDYFTSLQSTMDKAAASVRRVILSGQNASIAVTPLDASSTRSGYYSVSFYAKIETRDTVSSSLTVDIGWQDGVARSFSAAAMTTNGAATVRLQPALLIYADSAASITYATTWAMGFGDSFYGLTVDLAEVPA